MLDLAEGKHVFHKRDFDRVGQVQVEQRAKQKRARLGIQAQIDSRRSMGSEFVAENRGNVLECQTAKRVEALGLARQLVTFPVEASSFVDVGGVGSAVEDVYGNKQQLAL